MQFFLYEIVARVVAIYLCFDCSRELRRSFAERNISYVSSDWLDWILDWSKPVVFHRDTAPIRYWMLFGGRVFTLLACVVVAIFGWFQPNT